MSIKDLFEKNQEATQILNSDSMKNASRDAESERYVEENFPGIENRIKMGVVKRWAFFDKSFRLNGKNIEDAELRSQLIDFDKQKHKGTVADTMRPFELIFFELGAEVLKSVENF